MCTSISFKLWTIVFHLYSRHRFRHSCYGSKSMRATRARFLTLINVPSWTIETGVMFFAPRSSSLICRIWGLAYGCKTGQVLRIREVFFFMFGEHQSFFCGGHWYSCFGNLVTSALDFKARVDPLTCMLHCLCTVESLVSPLVRHLLTSWRPSRSYTSTCEQALVGLETYSRSWSFVTGITEVQF